MRAIARVPMLTRRRLTTGVALATVVLAGLTAAALPVSAASTTTPTPSTLSPAQRQRAMAPFDKCLASHGVKVASGPAGARPSGTPPSGGEGFRPPAGGSSGGGAGFFRGAGPNAKFAKAFAACRSKLPRGGFGFRFSAGGGGNFQYHPTPAQQSALSNYDKCMSSHGVEIASNTSFQQIRSLLQSDPSAATANKTCQGLLQGVFGPPPGSHPTTAA